MNDIMDVKRRAKGMINSLVNVEYDAAMGAGLSGVDQGTFLTELEAIGVFVSGVDNNISKDEIELMNYLFDLNATPRDMPNLISTLKGYHDSFMNKLEMPGWYLCKSLDDLVGDREATDAYIAVVKVVMDLFSIIDGDVDPKEEKYINNFVNRLKRDRL